LFELAECNAAQQHTQTAVEASDLAQTKGNKGENKEKLLADDEDAALDKNGVALEKKPRSDGGTARNNSTVLRNSSADEAADQFEKTL
jgi:hypothetical protein